MYIVYLRVPQESQVSVKCLSDKTEEFTEEPCKIDLMYITYKEFSLCVYTVS